MTNLDSIFKSRDITLPTKVHIFKGVVFPVVMYGCESWTIKKAECRRIDAFELWYWRRLLRVLWIAGRSNQSILKGNSTDKSLRLVGYRPWCYRVRHNRATEHARTQEWGAVHGCRASIVCSFQGYPPSHA